MDTTLADVVARAARDARRRAMGFSRGVDEDDLPWAVTKAFDASVRGYVERDPRIEDERDRVLIAAVNLAGALPEDGDDDVPTILRALLDAIDGLERATLTRGIVNRRAAAEGLGTAGQRVVPAS